MAGGEGSLGRRRRAAKSAEASAAAPQSTLGRCSTTKRKAGKEGSSTKKKKKAAKNPAPRATARKATEEEEEAAAPAVATAAAEAAPGQKKYRMTKSGIRYILNQKPMDPIPPRFAALRRSNPALTPQPGEEVDEDKRRLYIVAKAFFEMEEDIPRMQEWVRSELRTKGYVELDEEASKQRAEMDAIIDREWPAIQAQFNTFILEDKECRGKEYHGGDDSDSDESEDSDESDAEEDEFY